MNAGRFGMSAISENHTSSIDIKACLESFSRQTKTWWKWFKNALCGHRMGKQSYAVCVTKQTTQLSTLKIQRSHSGKKARSCTSRSRT